MNTKLIKGFIDPISLIGLGLLVVTLVVGSIFVNKGGINLNYKEKAGSALYSSCAEVPNNICNTIQGCNLKEIITSETQTACSMDDCNNNVSGCSSTNQIVKAGWCSCTLEGSTAKTSEDCKSSEFLGTCTWIPPVTSKTCSGNKTITETTKVCEGTPCGIEYSACCGQGYPNGTCNSGLTCSNIDGGTCIVKVDLPTTQPTPTVETNQTTETACGNDFEPCCNQGYPNGTCNAGLYCSNLDGGTCRTNVCHAERKCTGNVLQICKDDDSGWNNTTCQYGCSEITKDCKICNSGDKVCEGDNLKTCNIAGTSWETQTCSSNQTCDNSLKMCVATTGTCIEPCSNDLDCGDNNYCYKPSNGCPVCKAKGLSCTPGEKRCSSNFAQTCNTQGTSWQSKDCLTFGCNLTTKECNPDPTIISQDDCDKCLLTNSPSECQGACANIGEKIVDDSCTPNTNECFFGNLRTCSSSGTKGLKTCDNGCDILTNTCFELLSTGEACFNDKQCGEGNRCYTVQLTLEQRSISICASSQTGAALIADAKSLDNIASNPNTLIRLGLIAAAVGITQNPATAQYIQPLVNSFQNLSPSAIEFVGTLPGVYSSVKCNYNTILNQWFGNCTEQDILNQQYTVIGIQEAMNQQMIQSLAVRNNLFNTAKIIENQNSITIYKGVTLQARDILPQADQQIFKDVIPMGSDKALEYYLNNGSTLEDIAWWQAKIPGPNSPATSWTTDIDIAKKFAMSQDKGGIVVSMQIEPSIGISIPELAKKRGSWPSLPSMDESEMVLFGKIPESQYQIIEIFNYE